jgi:hypothetical protein
MAGGAGLVSNCSTASAPDWSRSAESQTMMPDVRRRARHQFVDHFNIEPPTQAD